MSEDDVRRVLSYPHTMIGSDGLPHDQHPHPRLWGTFPRVLGHYVRDVKLFPLEEAVRRMTSKKYSVIQLASLMPARCGYFCASSTTSAGAQLNTSAVATPCSARAANSHS